MFLKVLSHLILKIKSVMKYLKGDLEIFQNFHEIFHRVTLLTCTVKKKGFDDISLLTTFLHRSFHYNSKLWTQNITDVGLHWREVDN